MDAFVGFCAGAGIFLVACSFFIIALGIWRDGGK
jgi:hypothetical protein